MDVHLTNPAGRLWYFLRETVVGGHATNASLRRIWASYLGVDQDDVSGYISGMVAVIQQTDEIEDLITRLDSPVVPAPVLLRPVPVVRQRLAEVILGNQQVSWAVQVFDSGVLNDLEFCSHMLSASAKLQAADESQLGTIRSLVEQIIQLALNDAQLDTESREAILRYAHKLLRALDLYRVRGSQALLDELDRFTTETRRLRSKPSKRLTEKLRQLTGVIVTSVALFTAGSDIADALGHYGELLALPMLTETPGAAESSPPPA